MVITIFSVNYVVEMPETYLDQHPGGRSILLEYAGKNATKVFEANEHSDTARALVREYSIGRLEKEPEKKAMTCVVS